VNGVGAGLAFTRTAAGVSRGKSSDSPCGQADGGIEMTRNMSVALYVVALIAVVVSVDVLFFRNRLWERLIVNIGIVLVFAAFYLRFMQNP
jgi:hypothetical protein